MKFILTKIRVILLKDHRECNVIMKCNLMITILQNCNGFTNFFARRNLIVAYKPIFDY